jgi:hypothetical protein
MGETKHSQVFCPDWPMFGLSVQIFGFIKQISGQIIGLSKQIFEPEQAGM